MNFVSPSKDSKLECLEIGKLLLLVHRYCRQRQLLFLRWRCQATVTRAAMVKANDSTQRVIACANRKAVAKKTSDTNLGGESEDERQHAEADSKQKFVYHNIAEN